MEAAQVLAILSVVLIYLVVTGTMSAVQARRYRLAAREARFENGVREMEAFFWRAGLDRKVGPELLGAINRECRALIASIGTRPLDQLALEARRLEAGWMAHRGFARTSLPRRRYPAPDRLEEAGAGD
jgi:hypothetical protein